MKESTSKEKVLKKIRDALVNSMPPPYESVDQESSIYTPFDNELPDVTFAEAFSKVGGQFVYCANIDELNEGLNALIQQKKPENIFCAEELFSGLLNDLGITHLSDVKELNKCDVSVTGCELLVSRLGTIVLSSKQGGGRRSFIFPPLHIVVASTRQLVGDLKEAMGFLKKKYGNGLPSLITFMTGPSRTADIEKTLVHGAHGPKEVYLFLVNV